MVNQWCEFGRLGSSSQYMVIDLLDMNIYHECHVVARLPKVF